MRERPIPFNGAMVRATLDGAKTQTRRVVRKQFAPDAMVAEVSATTSEGWQTSGHSGLWWDDAGACIDDAVRCPFGIPGDRLWVREAWRAQREFDQIPPRDIPPTSLVGLEQGRELWPDPSLFGKLRPSMFMPRWASRITLEITGVRVERLQAISEADALAEGIVQLNDGGYGLPAGEHYHSADPRQSYLSLWESINGAGSVEANPFVWVVEFRRVD